MNIAWTIYYLSIIAWILPIFRQFRCNLFYFFLALGLSDPISLFLLKSFHLKPGLISAIMFPILFFTLNIDRQKPLKINSLEISVFILTFILAITIKNIEIVFLVIELLILIRILYRILIQLHHNQIVNLFYLVLAFYMTSIVASSIIYLNGDHQSVILFVFTLSFQIFIAIFFSIFREDNPKLTYRIVQATED
jgi:hypothetical protein